MRSLRSADRRFVTSRDDHQQVQVATLIWLPPRVRVKKPYLLRLELCREAAGHLIKQILTLRFSRPR